MQTTITEGEFKGHQAVVLVPVPKRQFAFLDLPTEVRLLIYEELFMRHDDGSHDIWRVNHSNAREDMLVGGRTGKLYFTWITPREWGGEFRIPWCARQAIHGINILRTNKHIYREAMAVLYWNNHWRFSGTSTMRIWLEAIGPNARAVLQSVELGGDRGDLKFYSEASAKKAASLLAACPNLQLLRFDFWWHWIRDRYPPVQLVPAWKPVFAMLAERQGRATIRSKVKIGQANWACGSRHAWDKHPDKSDGCPTCGEIKALNPDYEAEFNDEVCRVMGWPLITKGPPAG